MKARRSTKPAGNAPISAHRFCPICQDSVDEPICRKDGTATLSLDAPPSDPDRLQNGVVIADRYRIEQLIGTGGFAKVFRASHTGTAQSVALKVLNSVSFEDGAMLMRRFFREARASAGLRHPNTVRVFDFGQEDDGTLYLAMELLTGRTLRAEVKQRRQERNPLTEEGAIRIALDVAGSLAEAHALGLVHRDVGPNNIFLHRVAASEPVVKVLDFGLVKDSARPITRADQLFGTAAFMSPEQAMGRSVGPKSDLYSLGITMWWMIAGKHPFTVKTPKELMRCHILQPLPSVGNRASAELERIIVRATAKDPAERFADVQELKRALESCLEQAKQRRHEPTRLLSVARPRKRPRAAVSAAAIASLLAIGWLAPISTPEVKQAEPIAAAPVVAVPPPMVVLPATPLLVKRSPPAIKPVRAKKRIRPKQPEPAPQVRAKASILKERI